MGFWRSFLVLAEGHRALQVSQEFKCEATHKSNHKFAEILDFHSSVCGKLPEAPLHSDSPKFRQLDNLQNHDFLPLSDS